MNNNPSTLLIGATGLIGSTLGCLLTKHGYPVRVLLRHEQELSKLTFKPTEICFGNMDDQPFLTECISNTAFVLYFANSSIPTDSPNDPIHEITRTLPSLHQLLQAITGSNAHLIYPSSGGAVYGNTLHQANESTSLNPTSSYALGKVLSEEIIKFYAATQKIKFSILRYSNIYGATTPRKRLQGIIDTFLDNTKMQKISSVWGNPNTIRDYLHVHDAANAVLEILNQPQPAMNEIFNVGSGQSCDIKTILEIINEVTNGKHQYQITHDQFAGPQSSVININKFISAYPNWKMNFDLRQGIMHTWKQKQIT